MQIINLTATNEKHLQGAAELLLQCFEFAWNTQESAMEEVLESLEEGKISRIAIDESDNVIGWIGGISKYSGNVWEMHPLAVHPDWQKKGIGRMLVADFEETVHERGGITILLGTDDENGSTTLGGIDIYADLYDNMEKARSINGHPLAFYQNLGYSIVGVIPDANGFGKPDILMSKRVGGNFNSKTH